MDFVLTEVDCITLYARCTRRTNAQKDARGNVKGIMQANEVDRYNAVMKDDRRNFVII